MNYNSFNGVGDGFSVNQNRFRLGHQGGSGTNETRDQFGPQTSRTHSSQGGFFCTNPYQKFGESVAAPSATGPPGAYAFGRGDCSGGGPDALQGFPSIHPGSSYGFGDGGTSGLGYFDESFRSATSLYGSGPLGGQICFPQSSVSGTTPVLTYQEPRVLDVPRVSRPLTSGPERPLFTPLVRVPASAPAAATAPATATATRDSVLSYGFFGLPTEAPRGPPATPRPRAPAIRFSTQGPRAVSLSAAAQGYVWPPTPTAAPPIRATASSSTFGSTSNGGHTMISPPSSASSFSYKQPMVLQMQNPPNQQPKAATEKKAPSSRNSAAARRAANRPPPLRLLSGPVQRIANWLHLSQRHTLLFEIFGTLKSVTLPSAGQPRVLRVVDSSEAISEAPALQVLFWEMDRRLETMQPGQSVRLVGRALGRGRLQAFSARAASAAEMALARRLAFISQRAVADLTSAAKENSKDANDGTVKDKPAEATARKAVGWRC